ncbi:MAG: mechanosensitive ion channel family protein [Alphaproteobacteria bacterium]
MNTTLTPERINALADMAWAWTLAFLPRLGVAIAILAAGIMISRWAGRAISNVAARTHQLDSTATPLLGSLLRYAILILAIVWALGQLGVQTTSLLAVLGAAGLAIGLALQGTLSNISAGIMLLWLRPFRVGDYIEVGPAVPVVAGTVREVGLFGTDLETFDGLFVFAPNSAIWNQPLRNHTRASGRLLSFNVTVPADADVNRARDVLMDLAVRDSGVLRDPPPNVFVESYGAGGIVLTARAWVAQSGFAELQRTLLEDARRALGAKDMAPKEVVRTVPAVADPSRLTGALRARPRAITAR